MSDHFSAVADGYARFRPGYPDELFAYLASLPARRLLAWDCATGSGQAARGLVEHFDRVVATDLSAAQIANATAHPRIGYRVAPADEPALEDASADLVTVAQALHWLDVGRFYAAVDRVLAPGGAVAVWCYNMLEIEPRVNSVVGRYYSQVVGPYWTPERRLLEAGYRTVPFPFAELTVPPFEIRTAMRLADLIGYLRTWSATQRCAAATRTDPVARIAEDLAAAWGDPEAPKPARWPIHLRVGRRRRG